MPRVQELIAAAHIRPMRASLPEISSVSWTSFMTGTQPGEHGIFGFTDLAPDTYELRFPSFLDVQVPTLWDRLGRTGCTSVVLNQPSTYPARSIPGALVSGFVAIDLSRSVKPLRHLGPLRRMDYRIDIDTMRARTDHDFLLRELAATLKSRESAAFYLWEAVDWDLFELVVTGTDRLYHYLWNALEEPSHPHHQAVLDYHHAVDELVGRIFERFDHETGGNGHDRFWMLSDHGFCGIQTEVQLNAWLRDNGYLELEEHEPDDLTGIRGTSRAFALDPGRIYLNRRDRFGRGRVGAAEAADLVAELTAALQALEWNGKKAVREVFDAEDIYRGPRVPAGPDLVLLSSPGFDLKASPKAVEVFSRTDLVGMHTWDDAFLVSPGSLEDEGEELWIGDIAKHLMASCDL